MPLTITVPEGEFWDNRLEEFIYIPKTTITIEHSLAAVAKWESKWRKPFLSGDNISGAAFADYVRCMTLGEEAPLGVYRALSRANYNQIRDYMMNSMTATWFKEDKNKAKNIPKKPITAEIIYYYMVELGIPFECENWHFNRLMTLIRVCSEKNATPKKMSRRDILSQYASENAKRRAKTGSKG